MNNPEPLVCEGRMRHLVPTRTHVSRRILASLVVGTGLLLGTSATAYADITPHHDSMITTNACEDILLGWTDGQILDNLVARYQVTSERALQVVKEMRLPGNCQYDENF